MSPVVPLFSSVFFPVMCWFIIPKQKKSRCGNKQSDPVSKKKQSDPVLRGLRAGGNVYTQEI